MSIAEQIRILCVKKKISMAELARLTGQSPQNLSSKLKRESFTVSELEFIAKAVNARFEHYFILDNEERV